MGYFYGMILNAPSFLHIPVIGFFVNFGEISYWVNNKKNTNDQESGLILTGNYIEKVVFDKNVSLK